LRHRMPRDKNSGPPKYKIQVLTTPPWRFNICYTGVKYFVWQNRNERVSLWSD